MKKSLLAFWPHHLRPGALEVFPLVSPLPWSSFMSPALSALMATMPMNLRSPSTGSRIYRLKVGVPRFFCTTSEMVSFGACHPILIAGKDKGRFKLIALRFM